MELKEVQGLLARGHSDMKSAAYLMFEILDPEKFRGWLRKKLHWVTDGITRHGPVRVNIAFTYAGFQKIGLDKVVDGGFSLEFQEGMATDARARLLGDEDDNAYEHWNWGGPDDPPVHFMLMVYCASEEKLNRKLDEFRLKFEKGGIREIHELHASFNDYGKEHFGFKDGMGQPNIEGLNKPGPEFNRIPTGEFVLGYPNAYDKYGFSPVIPDEYDPEGLLHPRVNRAGYKDFGRNGSYMVFRQLSQDVKGFWNQIVRIVDEEKGGPGIATVEDYKFLAAKMFGRWPNGKPLSLSPDRETPYDPDKDEDFLFYETDRHGYKCPMGSHIRRSNVRDVMHGVEQKYVFQIGKRHRILRRGRPFGKPLVEDFDIGKMIEAEEDGEVRGLHFICFCSDISRQFEFIKHSWNNDTKFAGLYEDPDPILGIKDSRNDKETHAFTIQAEPIRRRVTGLHRFVHMLGGAYFFLPGFNALKYLAHFDCLNRKEGF